jgi:hypothetical protein
MHQHWWYSCYCPNRHTNFFLSYHHSGFLSHHKQSRSVEDKGCKMQSKVIIYIKFATKDETKEHGSFIDLVMLASFTRRFKEKL